jgi:hypothetical protein
VIVAVTLANLNSPNGWMSVIYYGLNQRDVLCNDSGGGTASDNPKCWLLPR